MKRVAIIGSGMAGAAAAAQLQKCGVLPVVFDKGRGVGGRMSTRRTSYGTFDHGVQFVTPNDGPWRDFLHSFGNSVVPWSYKSDRSGRSEIALVTTGPFRDLVSPLLDGATVHSGVTVRSIAPVGAGWTLETDDGQRWDGFAAVVLTAPAPQTLALAGRYSEIISACNHVAFDPVWCAMVAFAEPVMPDLDVLESLPEIAWAARMNSKPGRQDGAERWVLHARDEWTLANLEKEKPAAAQLLSADFMRATGISQVPVYIEGHRWRYARARQPLGTPCLVDRERKLIAAGDWCLGATVADAFESGTAAGRAAATLVG